MQQDYEHSKANFPLYKNECDCNSYNHNWVGYKTGKGSKVPWKLQASLLQVYLVFACLLDNKVQDDNTLWQLSLECIG